MLLLCFSQHHHDTQHDTKPCAWSKYLKWKRTQTIAFIAADFRASTLITGKSAPDTIHYLAHSNC